MPLVQTRSTEIEYLDEGPRTGTPVVLVHGFPDHPGTWDDVVAALPSGLRVIRPFLRGVGGTWVFDPEARSAQVAALATDLLDLIHELELGPVVLVGHDWGARAAYTLAALFPERVTAIAALALAYQPQGRFTLPDFAQSRLFWYQWFQCTEAGATAVPGAKVGLVSGFGMINYDRGLASAAVLLARA